MTNDSNNPDTFPDFDPPPPRAGEDASKTLDAETSARLHAMISESTGTTNPMEQSAAPPKYKSMTMEQAFPGIAPLSPEIIKLEEVRALLDEVKTDLKNLPQNIANLIGGR